MVRLHAAGSSSYDEGVDMPFALGLTNGIPGKLFMIALNRDPIISLSKLGGRGTFRNSATPRLRYFSKRIGQSVANTLDLGGGACRLNPS